MKREGWERDLRTYIEASRNLTFAWGETDCCLWVGRFVDLITGSNYVEQYEWQYNTEIGAQAYLDSLGFTQPADIADEHLRKIPIEMAKRGDVVEIEGGALGICDGRRSYFFVEGYGLRPVLTMKCRKAWEV